VGLRGRVTKRKEGELSAANRSLEARQEYSSSLASLPFTAEETTEERGWYFSLHALSPTTRLRSATCRLAAPQFFSALVACRSLLGPGRWYPLSLSLISSKTCWSGLRGDVKNVLRLFQHTPQWCLVSYIVATRLGTNKRGFGAREGASRSLGLEI